MGCIRYIIPKAGPKRGQRVESQLYNNLSKMYDETTADELYGNIFTEKFKRVFGDWETHKKEWKSKLDQNGEPLTRFITPVGEENFEAITSPEVYYVPEIAETPEIAAAKEWLGKHLGDTANVEAVTKIMEGQLIGRFHQGSIYLMNNAEMGVVFHEAFHAITQMFLTRGERSSIYDEIRRRSPKNEKLSEEEVEEILADEFSEYIMSGGKYTVPEAKKKQKSAFKRIWDAIVGLFYNNEVSITELYKRARTGKYAKGISLSRRAENFFNKYEMKSYGKKVSIDRTLQDGSRTPLTSTEIRMLMESMNYYFLDTLFKQGSPDALFSKTTSEIADIYSSKSDGVFGRMKGQLSQDLTQEDFIKKLAKQSGQTIEDLRFKLQSIYQSIGLFSSAPTQEWNKLAAAHKSYLKQYGMDLKLKDELIEDSTKEELIQEGMAEVDAGNFFVESIYFNTKENTPHAVKMLIAGLAKKVSSEDFTVNDLGLRIAVDYDETYNTVANKLALTPARWEAFESKLRELEHDIPGMGWLAQRLKVGESSAVISKDIFDLRIKFIQNFAKNKYSYLIGLIQRDTVDDRRDLVPGDIIFQDSNSSGTKDRIRQEWRGNLIRNFAEISGTGEIAKELTAQNWKTLLGEIKTIIAKYHNEKSIRKKKELLNSAYARLGIELNPITADIMLTDVNKGGGITSEEGTVNSAFDVLNNSILKYLEEEVDLFSPKSGVAGWINGLVTLEAEHNKDRISAQHISPDGKTMYGITLNTYTSIIIGELNSIAALPTEKERLDALETHLPHIFHSEYAKHSLIKNKILEGIPLILGIFDGYKYNLPGNQGIPTKELKEPDKYSQFINGTLKEFYSFLRTADRGIENFVSLSDKSALIENKEDAIINFKYYLLDEIITAKDLKEGGTGQYISAYRDMFKNNETGLRIFNGIITDSRVRSDIKAYINREDITREDVEEALFEDGSVFAERVTADILDYFKKRIKIEGDKLQDLGIYNIVEREDFFRVNIPGLSADALEGITSGDKISRLEIIEEALQRYVWNSTAAYIEQTKVFFGDLQYFGSADNVFKRAAMFNSTKKISVTGKDFEAGLNVHYPRKDGKTTGRRYINTVIFEDVIVESDYLGELEHVFTNDLLQRTNSEGTKVFTKDGKTLNGKGKIILNSKLQPFKEMVEADGLGYVSMDEYREMRNIAGEWLPGHENIYQKIMAGETLKISDIYYLQPLKTQYTGPLIESSLTGNLATSGLNVPTGYKHALIPLIPTMFRKGHVMNSLAEEMQKPENQWGIAQFRSGNKFGTVVDPSTGEANPFYREITVNNKSLWEVNTKDLITQTIDYKYFGIQQDISSKVKTSGTVGTQQRVLIQSNAYMNGKIASGVSSELKEKLEKYDEVQSKIIDKELTNFMDKMSITKVKTPFGEEFKITDGTKFVDFLIREAEERNSSDNVLDSIVALNIFGPNGLSQGVDKLDTIIAQNRLENLLMSLVNNNIIREQRVGGAKVQVASTGFEYAARSKSGEYYRSGELKFYREENGTFHGMEIMIPAPHSLLKHYGSIDNLNKALEAGELDSIKNLVGYRIPTQVMSSIDFLTIKKFLPTEAGDIIVLPTEVVAKAGSDYDIDKLNIFMQDFHIVKGKIVPITGEGLRGLKNEMLDLSLQILSDPYNRSQLLSPISDALLIGQTTSLVDDIRELKGKGKQVISWTEVAEGLTNMERYKYFMAGKGGVGQVAVHEVNHVTTQKAGVYIKDKTLTLFFNHNEIEIGGEIKPSDTTLADTKSSFTGNITQEMFGENDVMVFGANTVGGHGQGVAALAYANTTDNYRKWNPNLVKDIEENKVGDFAIAGKNELTKGKKGTGYGLVTKEAYIKNGRLVIGQPLDYVALHMKVEKLYDTARANPNKRFIIPYNSDKNLNRQSLNDLANIFGIKNIPINVVFGDKMFAEIKRIKGTKVFETAPDIETTTTTIIEGIKYPSLAGITDVTGNWEILEALSAFMNAYVDIAKDPYIFDLNAGTEVANTIFYMLRLGADPHWLARFVTQPSIENYIIERAVQTSEFNKRTGEVDSRSDTFEKIIARLRIGSGSTFRTGFQDTIVASQEKIESILTASTDAIPFERQENQIEKFRSDIRKREELYTIPSFEDLGKMVGKTTFSSTAEKDMQIQVLDNFLEYRRQSKYLQKLIRATSPSTRGVRKNLNELSYSLKEKEESLEKDNFFGNIEKVFEKGFNGAFQRVLDTTYETYSPLTISHLEHIRPHLDRMKTDMGKAWVGSPQQQQRVREAIDNEFQRYVILTAHLHGKALGVNIRDNYNRLFAKENLENTIKKLQSLRKTGNLKDNIVIKNLLPILENEKQDNVKMFNSKLRTEEENQYIEAFEEVLEQDPALARDLAMISIIQSGKIISPISFTKIIPNSLYRSLTKEALDSITEQEYMPDMGQFEDQFYRNNPQLVPLATKMGAGWKLAYSPYDIRAKLLYLRTVNYQAEDPANMFVLRRRQDGLTESGEVTFSEDVTRQILGDGRWFHDYRAGDNLTPTGITKKEKDETKRRCP